MSRSVNLFYATDSLFILFTDSLMRKDVGLSSYLCEVRCPSLELGPWSLELGANLVDLIGVNHVRVRQNTHNTHRPPPLSLLSRFRSSCREAF